MEVLESHKSNGRNEDRVTQMEEFQKKNFIKINAFIFKLIKHLYSIVNAFILIEKHLQLIKNSLILIENAFINAFIFNAFN